MNNMVLVLMSALLLSPLGFADSHEAAPLNFIKATDLLEKMQGETGLYVFDVRTIGEYDQGHIDGSMSLPLNDISQPRLNSINGMNRDSVIVTYCGCPHHLSGLAARQLTKMNYTDVRVLEEGFWYWKEQRFPILPAMSEISVSKLSVAGKLVAENKPTENVDIFIRHAETGQLEATTTDASGNYELHLHVYGYQDDDAFEFFVVDLGGAPAKTFVPGNDHETGVVVTY